MVSVTVVIYTPLLIAPVTVLVISRDRGVALGAGHVVTEINAVRGQEALW